jgi:predicted homoserine dehydrogenase-like protein
LKHGESLDGEGGYTVYGKILSASESVDTGALPLGLAHGCKLRRNVGAHETVRWDDVEFAAGNVLQQQAIAFRREMEHMLD